jgi:hypothetical protein
MTEARWRRGARPIGTPDGDGYIKHSVASGKDASTLLATFSPIVFRRLPREPGARGGDRCQRAISAETTGRHRWMSIPMCRNNPL